MRDWSEHSPKFPYIKCLQAIDLSFVTITEQLSNKIGETFCEGLKLTCKLFEIDRQIDFPKPVIFSKSFKHFIIELAHRYLY